MRQPSTFGRFSAGDALRGLSALGVLGLHVTVDALSGSSPDLTGVEIYGAMRDTFGVVGLLALFSGQWLYVFFVLSGYLIARPFVHAYVRGERQPDIARYARNRVLRIVPAFWVAVLATLLVFGLLGSNPWVVPLTMLFGQAFAPVSPFVTHIAQGWTLGAEVTFYALVPLAAVLWGRSSAGTPTGRGVRLLVVSLAMVLGAIAWRVLTPSDDATYLQVFPAVAGAFAPGLALAVAEVTWPAKLETRPIRRFAAPVVLAGVALFLAVAATSGPNEVWRYTAAWIGAGLIVGGALMREWSGAPAWKLLRNPVTDWLGERSYSIYVLHYGIAVWLATQFAVMHHPWESLAYIAPLGLLITLVLATLSWNWVERPCLRLRKRWATPPPKPAPPAAEVAPAPSD